MKKFLVLWISQAVSLFGSAVVEFALAWYLTIQTGSATVLATAMLVAFLPPIFLGPLIGPLVDRWNRKLIMISADLFIMLMTVGLVVLFLTETIQVWHVYLAMVLRAVGQSFHFPAMQAAIPMIVPEKDLSRAAGLTQMLQGVITIAGPPMGAFLLGILSMQWVLSVDIITAIIAVGCLTLILIPQPARAVSAARTSVVSEMMEGFRYIWNWRGLTMLIGLSAIVMFFLMPAFTLLPILVTTHLKGEVLRLGWLNSAFGFGMIAGGLLLGAWGGFKRRIVTGLVGVLVAGAATIGLGFTSMSLFLLGVTCCFLVGMGLSFGNGPIMAALQSLVAKDMQGRVFSLMGSVSSIMTPLGLALAGPLTDAIGISTMFYVAGAATVIVSLGAFFIPSLMNLEKTPESAQQALPVPPCPPSASSQ
jgi:MFS transporter, DHA3 family, macrolide efflux protein